MTYCKSDRPKASSLFMLFGLSPKIRAELPIAILLQMAIGFAASVILDGGFLSNLFLAAASGWWAGFFLVLIRRNARATALDLLFIKLGLLATLLLTFPCMGLVSFLR
jgi:hypothetical protein